MTKEILIKRLLYQSNHRGCKETDMILGNFAKQYLHLLNSEEILLYENFINERDWDIYVWCTGQEKLPEKYDTKMIRKIINVIL